MQFNARLHCVFFMYITSCTRMRCNINGILRQIPACNTESPCVLSVQWKNMPSRIPQYENPLRFHQRYPGKTLKCTLCTLYFLGLSHFPTCQVVAKHTLSGVFGCSMKLLSFCRRPLTVPLPLRHFPQIDCAAFILFRYNFVEQHLDWKCIYSVIWLSFKIKMKPKYGLKG